MAVSNCILVCMSSRTEPEQRLSVELDSLLIVTQRRCERVLGSIHREEVKVKI